MRILFCAIPALLAFALFWFACVMILGSNPENTIYGAALVGASIANLGWQVTCPKREQLRQAAAKEGVQ